MTRLGGECSLYIDMQPDAAAPFEGDWITTAAGSRYLVTSSRMVASRRHDQRRRYQLRCARLPKGCEVPADVREIELSWYRR